MEKVFNNLYKIDVPLPNNPLKSLNSYVLKTGERNLVIDTGMNRDECMEAMENGLSKIGIEPEKTDFFITHMHADHSGLVSRLSSPGSTVYCSEEDGEIISSGGDWEKMLESAGKNGFPESLLCEAGKKHPGYKYSPGGIIDYRVVKDGDYLTYGDYNFRCVKTPGHTKGHMCLYEPGKGLLIAGDHLLRDITPNISVWIEGENPLEEYLKSLDKVAELEVHLVLPGHRVLFKDCRKRIEELKHHHEKRTEEVLEILRNRGSQTAYQAASLMSWDMKYDTWEEFPLVQKWFATGEALAHLRYLEDRGLVAKYVQQGKYRYHRVD